MYHQHESHRHWPRHHCRTDELDGPSQELPDLKQGRGYELRAYVKLLNDDSDKLWQQFKAIVKFDFNDSKASGRSFVFLCVLCFLVPLLFV